MIAAVQWIRGTRFLSFQNSPLNKSLAIQEHGERDTPAAKKADEGIGVLGKLPLVTGVDLRDNLLDLSAGSPAMKVIENLQSRGGLVLYLPQKQPPQVEVRRQWIVAANETTRLAFSLMDDTTIATQVVVTAHSSNPGLIPDSNIVARPTSDAWFVNWELSVTPVANQAGVATVTLTATDSTGMSTNIPILVEVRLPQLLDGQALNCPELKWRTYGEGPWFSQTNVSHDGGAAVQSGSPGSWLESTVEGPGTLTFWWRAASTSDWAGGAFVASSAATGWSDRRVLGMSGMWQQASIGLPAGSWHLKWDSVCEPWLDGGSKTFWVDEVSFVPGPPACWLEVLPGPPADFVLLVLHGESGAFYEVETSGDLRNWSVLRRIQLNYSASVTQESNPESGARFYRMRRVAALP